MYTIEYAVQLPGEAAPRRQTLQSDEPSWAALANAGPSRVVLPPAIFMPTSAVSDEVLATWDGTMMHLIEQPVSAVDLAGARVVMLVVESPHTSEYRQGFVPVGLLQDPATRTRLRKYLSTHLSAMGVPAGATVVVSNPVQWQASLGSLRPRQRPGKIRTVMWNELFNAGWKANFQARVAKYGPKWILNACTAAVKAEVDAVLPSGVPVWVTSHPSSKWFEKQLATRVR